MSQKQGKNQTGKQIEVELVLELGSIQDEKNIRPNVYKTSMYKLHINL